MADLTDDYIIEAREHLDEMESHLLQLEKAPEDTSILNSIFTDVHTIKGAAQFTGLTKSSELAHKVEDLLDLLRQGNVICDAEMIDVFIASRDRLAFLVNEIDENRQENSEIDDLVEQLNQLIDRGESSIEASDDVTVQSEEEDSSEDAVVDDRLFQDFLIHAKEQFEQIANILAQFKKDEHCQDQCQKLIAIFTQIGSTASPLGFDKITDLSNNSLTLLGSIEQQSNLVKEPALNLLVDINERFTVLLYELELFQLEATPIDDLLNSINTLTFSILSEEPTNEINDSDDSDDSEHTDYEAFIESSRITLNSIESDVLSLENERRNDVALTSMVMHLESIQTSAQLLDLRPIEELCQQTALLLHFYIDNEKVVNLPLMEILSEIEVQLLMSMAELENAGQVTLDIDDLLDNIKQFTQSSQDNTNEENRQTQSTYTEEPYTENKHYELSDRSIIDLSNESYSEEYDQELFDIFIQQLQKTLQALQQQIEKQPSLTDYNATIHSLKSSANYMGYDRLVEFYQHWLERIHLLSESNDELPNHEFMFDYIKQLLNTFPQLKLDLKDDAISQETMAHSLEPNLSKIEEINDNDEVDLFSQLNQTFEASDINDHADKILGSDNDQDMNDALFSQLSQAIESSVSHNAADETIHELFDEILTENEVSNDAPLVDKETLIIPTEVNVEAKTDQIPKKKKLPKKKKAVIAKKTATQKNPSADKKVLKRSVRVDANKIDTLMNQVGELIVDKGYFHQLFNELRLLQKELKENGSLNNRELKQVRAFSFRFAEAIVSFSRTSNDLQEGVMKVRMLPISQLFDRYPRLIHDLVNRTEKKVNLEVRGEDTELDKMIIEEISDPLIHLIRNAVDHGIETVEERKAVGKTETATLLLEAYNESNHIVIEISDDGRGIDPEKIKIKALEKSLYNDEELARMSQKELTHLIMLPGFSTAAEVSNTSGRGVGMDVVKKNIEKLNGILEIDSKPDVYTKMRLKIPLTLAIIRALQVRVGKSFFTIPLSNVEETLRVYNKETSMMEGTKVIHLRGKTMPIIYLSKLFNIPSDQSVSEKFFVVTVNTGMQQIGLIVDELLGQAEVVIKPLVDYLQEKSGFSGATIIGDGKISLILDIYELINMSTNKQVLWHQQQMLSREKQALNGQF